MKELLSPLTESSSRTQLRAHRIRLSERPSDDSIQLAQQIAGELKSTVSKRLFAGELSPHVEKARNDRSIWKYVGAFSAGVAVCLLGLSLTHSAPVSANTTACLWLEDGDVEMGQNQIVQACVACHLTVGP